MQSAAKALDYNPFCTCGQFGAVRPIARFQIVHKETKQKMMHSLPLNFTLCAAHKDAKIDDRVFAPAVRASISQQLKPAGWIANFQKREIVLQKIGVG